MSIPLVGVVMAVYNCKRYVKKALQSIFNQSFRDFELFIIIDGCNDKTEEVILDTLKDFDGKFSLIKENVNRGCFNARMTGINLSKNTYIAIADADDISLAGRFEKQLEMLENNPKMWCIAGWATKIDENGKILGKMDYTPQTNKKMIQLIKRDPTINPIIDPTTMFRKEIFYELGGYSLDKEKNLVSDMNLWLKGLSSDKVFGIILEPLILYTHRPSGNTNKFKRKMIIQHIKVRKGFLLSLKAKKV